GKGGTAAIQGFGNVGSHLAAAVHAEGVRVIAVTDVEGGVHNGNGLDIPALIAYAREHRTVTGFEQADPITNEQLWRLPCDYMIPAALGSVITKEDNASDLQCRMLVEAANAPTTPIADKILHQRGIVVLPDFLANAGGVVVSYFEWTQNLQQLRWEIEEVYDGLERKLVNAYRHVVALARERNVPLRTAAYAISIQRVADAEELRGH